MSTLPPRTKVDAPTDRERSGHPEELFTRNSMAMRDKRLFHNVLLAIHSPKNHCFVPEGEVLTVRPRRSVRLTSVVGHHFVGTKNPRLTARFGWIRPREPFTLQGFLDEHYRVLPTEHLELAHVGEMLTSIDRLSLGMAVGADYFPRGIPPRMEFAVHRVIMYDPKLPKLRE